MARPTRKEFLRFGAALAGAASLGRWSSVLRAQSRQSPPAPAARPPAPLQPMAFVLALAHARFFGDAELLIDNNGPESQHVLPIWHAGGRQIPGEPIDVASLQSLARPLASFFPAGVTMANLNGLVMRYEGRAVDQVAAQVTLLPAPGHDPQQSLDAPLFVQFDRKGPHLEAVWATPKGDERSVIALFNVRADPHTVTIVDATSSTTVTIAPSASHILTRPASPTAGLDWIRFDMDDGPVAVFPTGFTMSPTDRVPRPIHFFDPDRGLQSDLFATGLRAQGASVTLALKNTTNFDLIATVGFLDPDGGFPVIALPRVELAAHAARRVDLAGLSSSDRPLPRLVGVRVRNSGAPGSLIGDLHASDPVTGLSYDVPLRNPGTDAGSIRARTGNAPIRLDGDYQTRLRFTNAGEVPGDFIFRILYDGGSYIPRIAPLAVGASLTLDLRRLRDDQTLDGSRRPLPKDFERGICIWSTRAGGTAMLAGRAEIVSASRRVCSSVTW